MDQKERLKAILSSKDTWLAAAAAALLLTVWGATITPFSANTALTLVVALAGAAVYFNQRLSDDSRRVRMIWTATVSAGVATFCYVVLWSPPKPSTATIAESTTPLVEYRVRGVEKRTWEIGTESEFKSLVAEMEIVNQSARAMTLEFSLVMHITDGRGADYPISIDLTWIDNLNGSLILSPEAERTEAKQHTYVNVRPNSAVMGHLVCEFPKKGKDSRGPDKWDTLSYDKMELRVLDRVTGKSLTAPFRAYPSAMSRPFIELDFPEELQPILNEDGTARYGPVIAHVIGVDDAHPLSPDEKQRILQDRSAFTITKQNALDAAEAAKKAKPN